MTSASSARKLVGIVSKPDKPELKKVVPELVAWFAKHNYEVVSDRETAAYGDGTEVVQRSDMGSRPLDFVVVLGGDGTLLSAARSVGKTGIPILGVNLGTLGFLTEVPLAELYSALQVVDSKGYTIDSRSRLHCQLVREDKCIASYDALNDVILNKATIARLSDLDLYINQEFVSNYQADGLIVSTPTGSSAYSMSAGGPILMPSVQAFVITPVSPHALTHRPVVVPDSVEISILVKTDLEKAFLSIDGQEGMPVENGDRVVCRKSDHSVNLLRIEKTFFDVLSTKLKWGQR
jgi:NAD+ kinase